MRSWIHDRALTLVLMALFVVFLAGQVLTGLHEYNDEQAGHGQRALVAVELPGDRAIRGKPSSRTGRASSCRWRRSSC